MNNDFWSIKKENNMIRECFKLNQIKLEHFYYNSGEMNVGMPLSTSIELSCSYEYENQSLVWKKEVIHSYASLEDSLSKSINSYEEVLSNGEELVKELETIDLRELKNNYFSEEDPERLMHWEITYNNYFKIVGTYDNEVEELGKLSEVLDFKKIMNEEKDKVKEQMANMQD